ERHGPSGTPDGLVDFRGGILGMANGKFTHRCMVALARNWSLILATTLVLAVLTAGLRLLVLPNTYDADAMILVANPRYQVDLESKFKSNQELLPGSAANVTALRTRLDTLAAVARTSEIEAAVRQRLADRLSGEDLRPGYLVRRVRVRPMNELL